MKHIFPLSFFDELLFINHITAKISVTILITLEPNPEIL